MKPETKIVVGYHFSLEDGRSRNGGEEPFEVGEHRKITGEITLCERGYHGCASPADALQHSFIYGPVIELCEFDEPIVKDETKFVSAGKRLVKRVNVKTELVLFAADCAERVLPIYEKYHPNDLRVRDCIEGVRAFVRGEIPRETLLELSTAASAAAAAASAAPYTAAAAYTAAYTAVATAVTTAAYTAAYAATAAATAAAYAATAAAYAATADFARSSEVSWQRSRFNEVMLGALK